MTLFYFAAVSSILSSPLSMLRPLPWPDHSAGAATGQGCVAAGARVPGACSVGPHSARGLALP